MVTIHRNEGPLLNGTIMVRLGMESKLSAKNDNWESETSHRGGGIACGDKVTRIG